MVMPFAVVTALLRLKSTFSPTLALPATVIGEAKVMVCAPGVPELRKHTSPATQEPTVALVVLANVAFTTPSVMVSFV